MCIRRVPHLRPLFAVARLQHTLAPQLDSPTPAEIAPLLAEYASHTPRPTTLGRLLSYARPLTPESVLNSVGHVLAEVPRMFGQRVRALESLPFIVGVNPFVARILAAHRRSFQLLATYPSVNSLDDNRRFTEQLEALVQFHANDIPVIAKGFQECSRYMSADDISAFLDSAIRNRLAVRLLAEQHIAISRDLQHPELASEQHIGVVDVRCEPAKMIKMVGSWVRDLCEASLGAAPDVVVDGEVDATFAYIPVHLEYILTEILKNAFRASVERHHKLYGSSTTKPIPPVVITISRPPFHDCSSPNFSSTSSPPIFPSSPQNEVMTHRKPALLSLRVRDQGGGVSPSHIPHIFSYSFTTARPSADSDSADDGGPYAAQYVGGSAAVGGSFDEPGMSAGGVGGSGLFSEITSRGVQMGMGTIAGLGYGLPMSRLYAMYFGGSLDFMSLDGWGSDVFVKLRCLDDAADVRI